MYRGKNPGRSRALCRLIRMVATAAPRGELNAACVKRLPTSAPKLVRAEASVRRQSGRRSGSILPGTLIARADEVIE